MYKINRSFVGGESGVISSSGLSYNRDRSSGHKSPNLGGVYNRLQSLEDSLEAILEMKRLMDHTTRR